MAALAALDDRPRPGKEPTITPEAKAWLVSLACDKAKEHGYPHELWTTRLLARHARERGPAAGHLGSSRPSGLKAPCASFSVAEEIKPPAVRATIWNARDAEFELQDGGKFCVSTASVQVPEKAAAKAEKSKKPVAIVSYDEKPGIQAIVDGTGFRRQCQAAMRASRCGIMKYKRHEHAQPVGRDRSAHRQRSTRSSGERHRSGEFIEFLKLLGCRLSGQHRDQADPRQSFRTHFEGNPSLASRHPAARPLRLYLHAQARLLAQLDRGLLL